MSSANSSPAADVRLINDALDAIGAQASAMNLSETRQLLVAELTKRGVMLPPPVVDHYLEDLMSRTGAVGTAQRIAKNIIHTARFATSIGRFTGAVISHRKLPQWDVLGTRSIPTDPRKQRAQVILEPGAQEILAVGARDLISVWLDNIESAEDARYFAFAGKLGPAEEAVGRVAVFRGDHRVGVLGQEASQAFHTVIRNAKEAGLVPVILAIRSHARDGSWSLEIGIPWNVFHPDLGS